MKGSTESAALESFRSVVNRPKWGIGLVEAALLVAEQEYPALDRALDHRRLAQMSEEVERLASGDVFRRFETLNHLRFQRWGFKGNRGEYYDPRNSFLNDVIDRRTEIPITFSLI